MKTKKILVLLIAVLLLTTGCGNKTYLKEDKSIVTYESTGQSLQNNILCKPEEKELYEKLKQISKFNPRIK